MRLINKNAVPLFAILILAIAAPALPQAGDGEPGLDSPDAFEQIQHTVGQLGKIRNSLIEKRLEVEKLKSQRHQAEAADKEEINNKLLELRSEISELSQSFEQIAIGGIDAKPLADKAEPEFDWREELELITRPVLSALKDLTEKPRRIEELRSIIVHRELQLGVVQRAMVSIVLLEQQQQLPPGVAEEIGVVAANWRQRKHNIERSQEVARLQLSELQRDDISVVDTVRDVLHGFVLGRGLTLLLAIVVGAIVWLVMSGLRRVAGMRPGGRGQKQHPVRIRVVLYTSHLITALFIIMAVLTVFYVRGDILLLALTVILLAALALGARQFVPRYVSESRLLLNIGPVREGERLVYNGVPLLVEHLNVYSELRNPELEGVVRLPLSALEELVSRPYGDEPWFPCRPGEFVQMADGGVVEIVQQTVELVRFRRRSSVAQVTTAEFIGFGVRNLSREGFGVASTFGIDYRHLDIALDQVPGRFKGALLKTLQQAELSDDVENILVDFKEAAANSLDYLLYVTMNGRAAASYYTVPRLMQQACVNVCNEEGWGIPFTQVTIHNADRTQPPLRVRDL